MHTIYDGMCYANTGMKITRKIIIKKYIFNNLWVTWDN